ncbi:hypothetical protein C7S18_06010 [Ahniella affigens]|uniref:DUF4062 domain-containing protein n=1 Tax=Ahniella affigens TaxID=2021234 RepID=A0A2P1PPK6_9GAMM|nr:DUF4062 domain-containing protein [Ahniella affigens]AVP96779.1 hypothetical protein C7S18_06010 [Ahniella affigens]
MARLRVFISSTCYDLDILRGELRPFISNMGYEPVMSDYSDILYDHRSHTHESCLKEVPGCDMVVLIIGSRFGGTAVPSALQLVDFASLDKLSTKAEILATKEKLSITQLEVLKAVEAAIPVYTFVDERVLHDHHVYEKNKDKKDVIDHIEFPSIQKRDTARYIFEFINFLTHRTANNSVLAFSRLEDIRVQLASQWSQLFQRLMLESRTKAQEARRYRDFSERIDDLKAVVLASLATPDLRDTAKGAVQFRHLIGFVSGFVAVDARVLLLSDSSWDDLLAKAGIVEIRTLEEDDRDWLARPEVFLIREDRTFYRFRLPRRALDDFRVEWSAFLRLDGHAREAIVDALLEDREQRRFGMLRYVERSFDEFMSQRDGPAQLALGEAS